MIHLGMAYYFQAFSLRSLCDLCVSAVKFDAIRIHRRGAEKAELTQRINQTRTRLILVTTL